MNFQTTADRIRANAPTSSLMATPAHLEALIHKQIKPMGWKQTEDQIQALKAQQERDTALAEATARRAEEKAQRQRNYRKHQMLRKLEHNKQLEIAKQHESPSIPEPSDGIERDYLTDPFRCIRLIRIVADIAGLQVRDIVGPERGNKRVIPRHVLCWILKKDVGMSAAGIGRALGGRDHTSVLHALRKIEDNAKFRKEAHVMRNKILWVEFERYGA